MGKLLAKVKFNQEKNAEFLIKAFFENYNAESSIAIKGKEAKLEIVFRKPPMGIINAISHCEIVELNCGERINQCKECETIPKKTEQKKAVIKTSEQTEKKPPKPINKNAEPICIPELEELAKKATSFEDFAKLIAKWLEMDKRQDFFINLVITSGEVQQVTWKKLREALKEKNVFYTEWDRNWAVQQVSKKMKKYSVEILPFLNVIRQYKESFLKKEDNHCAEEKPNKEETEKGASATGEVERSLVAKMDCMPKIKDFEKILASVDKTQPIRKRVCYVLDAMGLSSLPEVRQKQLVDIACVAVSEKEITLDVILKKANIPSEQMKMVQMTFSKFINDFVQKYDKGKNVKVLTFLTDLQKIIILEDEMNKA